MIRYFLTAPECFKVHQIYFWLKLWAEPCCRSLQHSPRARS